MFDRLSGNSEMAAANGSVNDVTEQLAKAKVDQVNEVTFAGKGLKLDTAEDGKGELKLIL